MNNFEPRLKGGHPNSLGNTIEIVEEVLQNHKLFEEFFNCYFSHDEVVRLRVSNGMKRIGKEDKNVLVPYIDRFLAEVSKIEQASAQWTLAQLFLLLEKQMSSTQIEKATNLMKHNLANHHDWIVLNQTMQTLGTWAKDNNDLKNWLQPHLKRLSIDERKSVAKRAKTLLKMY